MSKAVLIWAIAATLLAGFFLWRYEAKHCVENKVINLVDTAVIYIPMESGYLDGTKSGPGLKIPKWPGIIDNGKQKRFVIMPTITLGKNDLLGGTSMGISAMYLGDRWSPYVNYDYMMRSWTIGVGLRF